MKQKDYNKSRVISEEVCYPGNWLECTKILYEDENKQQRSWECVHRKNRVDAVIVIPRLNSSGRYIVIKQFRPPIGNYILEFPAGLIDAKETPEETAVRELKEETGYTGKIMHISPRLPTSPGMLSEACYFASLEIDETLEINQSPQPANEPEEFIEVFLKHPEEIAEFVKKEMETGTMVDIKFYTFFQQYLFV
ncbi:MAG: NUDIX hydrolase [SAR324 cluster bacterium]|nr:NUDIX hydrolase [SAR324 cluster bacterium]